MQKSQHPRNKCGKIVKELLKGGIEIKIGTSGTGGKNVIISMRGRLKIKTGTSETGVKIGYSSMKLIVIASHK